MQSALFIFTVSFRNRERITFDHLVSMKKPNDTAQVKVLRDGEEHEFTITLRPVSKVSSSLVSSKGKLTAKKVTIESSIFVTCS